MSTIDPDELDDLPGTPPPGMSVEQYRRILDPKRTPLESPEKTALPGRGLGKRTATTPVEEPESRVKAPPVEREDQDDKPQPKKRTMSAAARAKIAEAQRRRHAQAKAEKAAAIDDQKQAETISNEQHVEQMSSKPTAAPVEPTASGQTSGSHSIYLGALLPDIQLRPAPIETTVRVVMESPGIEHLRAELEMSGPFSDQHFEQLRRFIFTVREGLA